MDENQRLPNYDPTFCLKVAKWRAATCLAWLIIEVCILALVDPTNSRCPGWAIYDKNAGQVTSPWLFVGIFAAYPTIVSCFIVLRWNRYSQRVCMPQAGRYTPFLLPKVLYDRYKPDPFTFLHTKVFVIVTVGWCLFCTIPLWIMLINCSNLPLGY
jgi:hypothetical protein